jgi:hypothetical protein
MPKYTKQHFEDIAGLIKQIPSISKRKAEAEKYCKKFKADNEKFNKTKFLNACGLVEE